MKFVTFIYHDPLRLDLPDSRPSLGLLYQELIIPVKRMGEQFPNDMLTLIQGGEHLMQAIRSAYEDKSLLSDVMMAYSIDIEDPFLKFEAPLPNPTSFRDAYAFRQHVETSRQNRGLEMISEFDEFPVFYFSNHQVISGPGSVGVQRQHLDSLDYELEIAIVIHKQGRNIQAKDADAYIGGFMVLNDWSARKLQMDEMKLSLGPAKGKDFATSMGPWLVTPEELEDFRVSPQPGHIGKAYDLKMEARVNGELLSEGNFSSMHWTFAEIIERVSYGVTLFPGDIIGSGTVGTGCLLELNGTGRRKDPQNFVPRWLKVGDVVELSVAQLGVLRNDLILLTDC